MVFSWHFPLPQRILSNVFCVILKRSRATMISFSPAIWVRWAVRCWSICCTAIRSILRRCIRIAAFSFLTAKNRTLMRADRDAAAVPLCCAPIFLSECDRDCSKIFCSAPPAHWCRPPRSSNANQSPVLHIFCTWRRDNRKIFGTAFCRPFFINCIDILFDFCIIKLQCKWFLSSL